MVYAVSCAALLHRVHTDRESPIRWVAASGVMCGHYSLQLFGLRSQISYLVYTLQSIIWFTLSNKLFGSHSQSKFIFLLAGSRETIIVPCNPAR